MDLPWSRTGLPVQIIANRRDKSPFIRLERLYHVRLQFIVNVKLVALHVYDAPQRYGRSSAFYSLRPPLIGVRPPGPPPPTPDADAFQICLLRVSDNSFRVILSDDIEAGPGCCVHLTSAHFTCSAADEC